MRIPYFSRRLRLMLILSLVAWGGLLALSINAQANNAETPDVFKRRLIDTSNNTDTSLQFLSADEAFGIGLRITPPQAIELRVAPGYYLYRDRIHVRQAGKEITSRLQFAPAEWKRDATFGDVEVYHQSTRILLPEDIGPEPLDIRYQGCADAGLCYPPCQARLSFAAPQRLNSVIDTNTHSDASALPLAQDAVPTNALSPPREVSMPLSLWALFMLYVSGIGLTFTPCVLPMLPIVCAIVVGKTPSRLRALMRSAAYVFGMIIAYVALGAIVGLFGTSLQLQSHLQQPWVLVSMAFACAVAAAWLFELFQLRLPLWLSQRVERSHDKLSGCSSLVSTAATGALSTLVLSPCLSAPLAGILVYLSASSQVASAMLGLAMLALGMGTPIMLCCIFGAEVLPKHGAWMETLKNAFGLLLLGSAVWLLARLLPGQITLILWGMLGLGMARLMGAFSPLRQGATAALQIASWSLVLWSIACILGAAAGGRSVTAPLSPLTTAAPKHRALTSSFVRINQLEALETALSTPNDGRPMLIDIYADWCISCQRMERDIYAAEELQPLLHAFRTIRFDITHADNETLQFLRKHGVFGPPGLLFFVESQEAAEYRLVGEASLEEVKARLHALLSAQNNTPPPARP